MERNDLNFKLDTEAGMSNPSHILVIEDDHKHHSLSCANSERDKVAAWDMGADDYLTKPFGIEELPARIRVAGKVVTVGPLTIDLAWHIISQMLR